MSSEETKATTQSTELMDVQYSPSTAVLKTAHQGTQLAVSDLEGLNSTDKELLAKTTDLEIDLSDAVVNAQNIEEALETLENCTQLNALKLKMPNISTQTDIRFKL